MNPLLQKPIGVPTADADIAIFFGSITDKSELMLAVFFQTSTWEHFHDRVVGDAWTGGWRNGASMIGNPMDFRDAFPEIFQFSAG